MARDKLHPEELKLYDDMRRQGMGVTIKHVEQASGTDFEDVAVALLPIDAGDVEQAITSARVANDAVKHKPSLLLIFTISGCIDDPREIDQIPEARVSLATLFAILSREAFHRCELVMQAQMLIAIGRGHRVGTELHIDDASLVKDPRA